MRLDKPENKSHGLQCTFSKNSILNVLFISHVIQNLQRNQTWPTFIFLAHYQIPSIPKISLLYFNFHSPQMVKRKLQMTKSVLMSTYKFSLQVPYIFCDTSWENLITYQDNLLLVISCFILNTCMLGSVLKSQREIGC